VIGAGTAGLVTAAAAAGLGRKVALVERHLMGGDCLNYGCVPSKGIIRAARAAADVRAAGEFGVLAAAPPRVDFARAMDRMRRLRAGIASHDSVERFASLGVDVFLGTARFVAEDAVEVDGRRLSFRKACIAAGARAAAPPIPGLEEAGYLTNETVFALTELPSSIAVIGAGPIGCEMAQTFARLGSRVFLVETEHGVLPREDRDAADVIEAALSADGVELVCCGRSARFETDGAGKRLRIESHGDERELVVDEVLVAAGRRPNVDTMNLEAAGVEFDERGIGVDDRLRTSNRRVFAAGDIASKYQFTHAADALARIVVRNALFGWVPFKARASRLVIPWCTYTEPELAHVGLLPAELEERGARYHTLTIPLKANDRSVLEGDTAGFLRVHVEERANPLRSGRILGATLVARHAGESIGELTAAIVHGIRLQKLSGVIHPYPTQAEVIRRAGDEYFKRWALGLRDLLLLRGRG
jgi:pyruvate/2-oxoglutarate dehydrogenase complex dihydrolipoamide dehydrogenase (E3) component